MQSRIPFKHVADPERLWTVGDTLPPSAPNSSPAPIHPNLHVPVASNPSSMMTSRFAVKALEDRGLLQALFNTLTSPVPCQNGDSKGDADLEERFVR